MIRIKHTCGATFFHGETPGSKMGVDLLQKQLKAAIRNPNVKQRLHLALRSNPMLRSEMLEYASTLCKELSIDTFPIDTTDNNTTLLQQMLWLLEYRAMMGLAANASSGESYLFFCTHSTACRHILETGNPLWLKQHLIKLYNAVIEIQESLQKGLLTPSQQREKRQQLETCIALIHSLSPSIEKVSAYSMLFMFFLKCLQHYSLATVYSTKEYDTTHDQVNANKALLAVGSIAESACALDHAIVEREQTMLVFLTLGEDLFQRVPINSFKQLVATINAQILAFQSAPHARHSCGAAARK